MADVRRRGFAATALSALLIVVAACGGGDGGETETAGSPAASLDVHGAADLEALLPERLGEVDLTRASYTGEAVTRVAGFDSTMLEGLLEDVGATTDDLSVGIAGDTGGQVLIAAIRVDGVSPDETVDFFVGEMDDYRFEERTVAGKTVMTTAGGGIYFYPSGDVMFEIVGENALAEEAIAELP